MRTKFTSTKRKPLRILAVGAHPDDIEICCAGTLARSIQRGDQVTMAIACKGDSASVHLPGEDISKIRSREARRSARLLGAEFIEMGLSDYCVDVNLSTKKLFADVVRQASPDVILTHFHSDYGSDHNNTFILVRDAALAATVPNFQTSRPAVGRMPAIFMWEPLGGYGFQPNVFVNIADTFETKVRMLKCHQSQREWFKQRGGFDFLKNIEVVARFRGYQSGAELAEGFVPLENWGNIPAGPTLP